MKKLTHEEYVRRVQEKHNGEIEVLGQYTGGHDKIRVRHNVPGCNHEWEPMAFKLIKSQSTSCPKCYGTPKKTQEQFVEQVKQRHGDEIEVIGEYKNGKTKIRVRHRSEVCQFYEWDANPDDILRGSSCPKCNGRMKLTHDEFVARVNLIHNNEIEVLGVYKNNHTKVRFRHSIEHGGCGHEWESKPLGLMKITNPTGCPKCGIHRRAQKRKMSHDEFVERVKEVHNNEIEVLSMYTRLKDSVRVRHIVCGCEWEPNANNLVNNKSGCPRCLSSKGEALIRRLLKERNIEFREQYTFEDCRYERPLYFDFAVFQNNRLITLIEYDGQQHFEPVDCFGGEEGFRGAQLRDRIKNEYCAKNNIPLLRIPYWKTEEEVSDMIDDVLVRRIATYQAS